MAQTTILIVDDEPNQRFILERALHMFNESWRIIATASAAEALEAIAQHPPDLIITDYHMPLMTGIEMIEVIRKQNLAAPVIMMTAYGTPELQRTAEGLGITHFLTKPVPLTTLRRLTVAALQARAVNDTAQSVESSRP
jgi:two-component system, response regulator, stage 0 sporulation protein F